MINNVIFDLDGTLFDTSEGIIESVKYAVKEMHLSELKEDELLAFVGPPLKDSFMRSCGIDELEAEKAVRRFRKYYADHAILRATPYDGVYDLIALLKEKNISISVATYKPEEFAKRILKHFKMDDCFNSIHGADKSGKQSKEDIVQLCLEDISATADDTVLVGDTHGDEEAAQRLGIWFLPVSYGFGFNMNSEFVYKKCLVIAYCPFKIREIFMGK